MYCTHDWRPSCTQTSGVIASAYSPHGSPSGVRSSRSDLAGPPEAERTAKLQLIRPLHQDWGWGRGTYSVAGATRSTPEYMDLVRALLQAIESTLTCIWFVSLVCFFWSSCSCEAEATPLWSRFGVATTGPRPSRRLVSGAIDDVVKSVGVC